MDGRGACAGAEQRAKIDRPAYKPAQPAPSESRRTPCAATSRGARRGRGRAYAARPYEEGMVVGSVTLDRVEMMSFARAAA